MSKTIVALAIAAILAALLIADVSLQSKARGRPELTVRHVGRLPYGPEFCEILFTCGFDDDAVTSGDSSSMQDSLTIRVCYDGRWESFEYAPSPGIVVDDSLQPTGETLDVGALRDSRGNELEWWQGCTYGPTGLRLPMALTGLWRVTRVTSRTGMIISGTWPESLSIAGKLESDGRKKLPFRVATAVYRAEPSSGR